MSANDWNEYIQTPEGGYAKTKSTTTPSRLRTMAFENAQNHHISNDRKRGPSTPLTPTLIQKNIVKKQFSSHERRESLIEKDNGHHTKSIHYTYDEENNDFKENESLENELQNQENQEGYIFSGSNKGSPVSKKPTPLGIRLSGDLNTDYENLTPKIRNGIKLAVKESKKNRIQMMKDLYTNDNSASDSEYSEVSTIAGDTPNFKIQHQNLIYFKNGYYLNNDDSMYESEKENLINKKELNRVNDLLEFMKLEKQFEAE